MDLKQKLSWKFLLPIGIVAWSSYTWLYSSGSFIWLLFAPVGFVMTLIGIISAIRECNKDANNIPLLLLFIFIFLLLFCAPWMTKDWCKRQLTLSGVINDSWRVSVEWFPFGRSITAYKPKPSSHGLGIFMNFFGNQVGEPIIYGGFGGFTTESEEQDSSDIPGSSVGEQTKDENSTIGGEDKLYDSDLPEEEGCEFELVEDKVNHLRHYKSKFCKIEFMCPEDWEILYDSKYQRVACFNPEYRKTDLTCGKKPLVGLGRKEKIPPLSINLRQCLNIIELLEDHFICFDYALSSDERGDYFSSDGERLKYVDEDVKDVIDLIKNTFQVIK